jgi:hypothetical protein
VQACNRSQQKYSVKGSENTIRATDKSCRIQSVEGTVMPPFKKAEELLPPEYFDKLSRNARNVFATVWNRLNNYGSATVWMLDTEIVRRAGIRQEQLASAQSELSRAGLLEMLPGLIQTRYRILDPDAPNEISTNGDVNPTDDSGVDVAI